MGFKSSVVDPVGSSSVCRIRLFSLNILPDPVVFTQTFCWILSDPHHFAIMEFKKKQFLTLLHETALETWKSIRVREFTGWVWGDRKKSWVWHKKEQDLVQYTNKIRVRKTVKGEDPTVAQH